MNKKIHIQSLVLTQFKASAEALEISLANKGELLYNYFKTYA